MATFATFIGGAPLPAPKTMGFITVDDDGVRFAPKGARPVIDLRWDDVEAIEVAGSDTVASTSAANVLAFGVLGFLGSGEKKQCYMVVSAVDGTKPTFAVRGMTPFEAMTRLRDNAATKLRDTAAPARPASAVDDLARLVDLHAAGHLTDEEFTAAKRTMLGLG